MPQAFDAEVDESGQVRLLIPIPTGKRRRAAVVLLDDQNSDDRKALTRYQILKPLGSGGMGSAYLAKDSDTGQTVCVKRLNPDVEMSAVRQECNALERLRHVGLVRLIDQSFDLQSPFLVMELAEGLTLSSYLKRRGALSEPIAVSLVMSILEALLYAHAQQVVHRDLKPLNLMVNFDPESGMLRPKLLDFGIALVDRHDNQGQLTAQGNIAGTLAYMAPEQINGDLITPAVDIYALGVMAWQMVAGEPPFSGQTHLTEMLHEKMLNPAMTAPLRPAFTLSPEFCAWITACTQGDPASRPSGAASLAGLEPLRRQLRPGVTEGPVNLQMRRQAGDQPPWCWTNGAGVVRGASTRTEFQTSLPQSHNFRRLTMRFKRTDPEEFGCLAQQISAVPLVGRRVRLTCIMRPKMEDGWVGIWLRAQQSNQVAEFVHSKDQPLYQHTVQMPTIEMTVPQSSESLAFGAVMDGNGEADLMEFRLTLLNDHDGSWMPYSLWEDTDLLTDEEFEHSMQLT